MITRTAVDRMFSQYNVDVVAGVSEDGMNRFAAQHYSVFPALYKGDGDAESLDLHFEFSLATPVFDFAPIAGFAKLYKRAVLADPLLAAQRDLFRQRLNEPGMSLTIQGSSISFSSISTGDKLADLTVDLAIKAAVVVNGANSYRLFVVSVDIDITDKRISKQAAARECDIEKLIEHILKYVLRDRLNRFLQSYPLPQPQQMVTFLATELALAQFVDNTLLVGLKATGALSSELTADFGSAVLPDKTAVTITGDNPKIATLSVKNTKVPVTPSFSAAAVKSLTSRTVPQGDLFIALSERAFQLVADSKLNIDKMTEKRDDESWYYSYFRTWYRVWSPSVKLVQSGLEVAFELAGGAEGGAGLKGCSSWIKCKLGAEANAIPGGRLRAGFYTQKANELWLAPFDYPFLVIARAYSVPPIPILDFLLTIILSSITSLFTGIILPLISVFMTFKLISLPEQVPGMPIPAKPTFASLGNWDDKLYVGVNFSFGGLRSRRAHRTKGRKYAST